MAVSERIELLRPLQKTHSVEDAAKAIGVTSGQAQYAIKVGNLNFRKLHGNYTGQLEKSDIPLIRELYSLGFKIKEIAYKFDASYMTIYNVVRGKTWNHVRS